MHEFYGDMIITEGIKGNVKILKKIDKKVVSLGTLKEGNVFEEMGLISQSVRTANISALGKLMVGVIDKKHLKLY